LVALPSVEVYLLAEAEKLRHVAGPLLHPARWRRADRRGALKAKLDEKTGWCVPDMKMDQLRHAAGLDKRLRIARPRPRRRLCRGRLNGLGQAIRRIGAKCSGHLRTLAVGLGNRLHKVGEKMGKRPPTLPNYENIYIT
ncbi:hypothetical protein BAE44_0025510, partial [Dichanthelium oligosanthes]